MRLRCFGCRRGFGFEVGGNKLFVSSARFADSFGGLLLLLVGEHPYPAKEVGAFLACKVIGVLADDPVGAAILPLETALRRLERSPLLRSARSTADQLAARLQLAPHSDRLDPAALTPMNGNGAQPAGDRR